MPDLTDASICLDPRPMPYHRAIVAHLRDKEPGLWTWFSSTQKRLEEADAVRLDLLKSTYRLEPQAQPELYELANTVRDRLGLKCEITLYQAQTGNVLNAALAYVPGEAHVILAGPLASVLEERELRAVLAHELAHYLFYEADEGCYLIASDLLRALSADPEGGPAASESFRLYSLWTEIYADEWAYRACGEIHAAVAALLKIETGLAEVNAGSYLRQADEVFAKASAATSEISHPESTIRARALRLWAEQGDQAQVEIERMIQGGLNLNRLDFLGQARAADLTNHFLQSFLAPRWFHTDAVLGHAKRFFADFTLQPHPRPLEVLQREVEVGDSSIQNYICYLMLDFATVDADLGDVALSASILFSRRLGMDKRFAEIVQKELGLGKKAFARIDNDAEKNLAKAEATESS